MDNYLDIIMSINESSTTEAECDNLYKLALEVNSGAIVEIGSHHGRTAVALALGIMNKGFNVPLYCIEPHEYHKAVFGKEFGCNDRVIFFKNMLAAKVVDVIRLVNLNSVDAAKAWDPNRKISLLWIDGDHTYEGAKADFESWEPYVPIGGIIALHDTIPPFTGPKQVVDEALSTGRFHKIAQVERNAVLRKIKKRKKWLNIF